ncbi:uncharacterized protein LOC134709995 isoform X1 [Mytilus trossulus]|uniref:uncharacterized protein LOC134709995 isoform X1 n=1 Tax=Mytilus trossulus TaxID=6551 RepID=UPI0030065733
MADQNYHAIKLEQMCRLCGKNVSTKYAYNKTRFKVELDELYNIDIEAEPSEVFPSLICRKDSRDLYRYRTWRSKNDQSGDSVSNYKTELFDFLPHSDEECNVCIKKKWRTNVKRRKTEHPNESSDMMEGTSSYNKQGDSINDAASQTSFTDDGEEHFPYDLMKNLMKAISQKNCETKEKIFMDLIHEMPLCDVELFSYCLGKKVQTYIVEDASSFALQYKDPKAMARFNVKAWLNRRNKSIISFLQGVSNTEFHTDPNELGNELSLARGVEQLYMLRCPYLITPISFLLNISVYTLTGSKLAVDIIGNCCPAGHYQTVTSWLREQGTKEPEIPIADLMNVFDNEQVIGRKSAIRPNQKVITSIITNKGVVALHSDQLIQGKADLKPQMLYNLHKQNEENENTDGQQELLNSITAEMMSQSSKRIIKMERDHFEQLYYFVNAAIEVVKQEQVLEGDKIEDTIDQKVAKDALDDLMMQCATCGTWNRKKNRFVMVAMKEMD